MKRTSYFFTNLFQRNSWLKPAEILLQKVIWRFQPSWFYYDRFVVMSYCLAQPFVSIRRLKSIRTRMGNQSDMPALHRLVNRGSEYAERFNKDDQVIVAELNGQIIGMQWIEKGRVHHEIKNDYCFPLPDQSVWTYDGHVHSAWRIKGVWAGIADELMQHLRYHMINTVYCMVNGLNWHSINSHLRYGYRIRRQVVCMQLCGLRIQFEKNLD